MTASRDGALNDLIARVSTTTGVSESDAARIVDEVLDHLSESVERYATRRHRELHSLGMKNDRIWPASSCAMALMVRSRRCRSSCSVTPGSYCVTKPR